MHKRRGCVHPLRPPSSNHCEEACHFSTRQPTYDFFLLWQRAGNIAVHDQLIFYSLWLRFHYTLRDSVGPKVLHYFIILTTIRCRIQTIAFKFSISQPHVLLPKTYKPLRLDSIALATTPHLSPHDL